MNDFLYSRFVETVHRLALGIEPVDAQGRRRLSYDLQVAPDILPIDLPRPPLERHASNRYSLRYQPGVKTPVDLRFFDSANTPYRPQSDRRRVVPRRLRIPILTLADVEAQEQAEAAADKKPKDFKRRIRRPVFYPGAAYSFDASSTGLRGRVIRDDKPMRWARIVATLAGETVVVGRAHGDDRGEFLLLINSLVTSGSAMAKPLRIQVSVFGPASVPTPASPDLPQADPLWDLPLETLANPGLDDPVANGDTLPNQPPLNYTASVSRVVEFTLGKCLHGEEDFVIT
ncbi:MAG TPA: hypothetical protein VGO68_21270 [Pyrinomonadaceae bacterium]|jgi:hypothetical protein|nr:hypothetical protein [Pyrinomonadaceae bacterium]